MFHVLALLVLFLAHVSAFGSLEKLPSNMKSMFEKFNKSFNKKLVWSDELEGQAFRESFRPNTPSTEATVMKLGQSMHFNVEDGRNLRQKLRKLLTYLFAGMENKVNLLPRGTHYGCSGYWIKMGNGDVIINAACLYKNN